MNLFLRERIILEHVDVEAVAIVQSVAGLQHHRQPFTGGRVAVQWCSGGKLAERQGD